MSRITTHIQYDRHPAPRPLMGNIRLEPFPVPLRWTKRLKRNLLDIIACGYISEAHAIARYGLSAEEIASWRDRMAKGGVEALAATHQDPNRTRAVSYPYTAYAGLGEAE